MNHTEWLVKAADVTIMRGGTKVLQHLDFIIDEHITWAIVGPSGSGKTSILQAIAGNLHCSGDLQINADKKVVFVSQQHRFTNLAHTVDFYYQQRFNSSDASDALLVSEAFPELFNNDDELAKQIAKRFSLHLLEQRRLIQLSNGENKRVQLAKALLQQPNLLLLDNPFVGLDVATREELEQLLQELPAHNITVVLTCTPGRIPSFVTKVMELNNGSIKMHDAASFKQIHHANIELPVVLPNELQTAQASAQFENAVLMRDVNIRYGDKQVLENVSWQVRRGERWLLSGPNGAGKSTLLSLITADNPQAYANEIYLFDKRRGSGESIWEIKRNIGFVSPELHLYFDARSTVHDTVASGLFDTIGLFRVLSGKQEQQVAAWLRFLKLDAIKSKLLAQLPLGQQRLALLARALIKNPPLLVLDEPMQGLDEAQSSFLNGVVDALCKSSDQTLIYVSHYNDELPSCIEHHLHIAGGKVQV